MNKLLLMFGLSVVMLAMASTGFCDERERSERCYGYGWGPGHMMGPGYGQGGGHMMGPGYGRGGGQMMGPGYGSGMHGRGWGPSSRGWKSMTPEQQEKVDKLRSSFQKETLELRQQLATKQMELETLWAQPDVDQAKIEKLSDEVANVQSKLWKKRNKYLVQCRKEFGDLGWACPGGW